MKKQGCFPKAVSWCLVSLVRFRFRMRTSFLILRPLISENEKMECKCAAALWWKIINASGLYSMQINVFGTHPPGVRIVGLRVSCSLERAVLACSNCRLPKQYLSSVDGNYIWWVMSLGTVWSPDSQTLYADNSQKYIIENSELGTQNSELGTFEIRVLSFRCFQGAAAT